MSQSLATEQIWTQLNGALRQFLRRRVRDESAVDDLLQEVFLRIHRHIESVADSERLYAWVYRIARNVLSDHYRSAARTPAGIAAEDELPSAESPASGLPVDKWMEEALGQLPVDYREAVRLAEIEGLPQREVAERLGLSLSGAKSRIQRGRRLLRESLDRCCHFEFDRHGSLQGCDPKPDRTICRDCDEP